MEIKYIILIFIMFISFSSAELGFSDDTKPNLELDVSTTRININVTQQETDPIAVHNSTERISSRIPFYDTNGKLNSSYYFNASCITYGCTINIGGLQFYYNNFVGNEVLSFTSDDASGNQVWGLTWNSVADQTRLLSDASNPLLIDNNIHVEGDGDFDNDVTATSFIGDGTSLTGVCLSDGTNCLSSASNNIVINNSIYVSVYGNDATALRNRLDKPFATLSQAVTNATYGDTIFIISGNHTMINKAVIPTGVTLQGLGNAVISSTNNTDVMIQVSNSNVTIKDLTIYTVSSGIGAWNIQTGNISNIMIDNVRIYPLSADSNAISWGDSEGGGASIQYNITATIKESKLQGGSNLGFGVFAYLGSSGNLRLLNNDVYGATDGVLFGNMGRVYINGGYYESKLDAITTGGTTITATHVNAYGEQADIYSDGGCINVYMSSYRRDYVVGNCINDNMEIANNITASKFIGDGSLLTGISSGGNPFNQVLNTTSNVQFNNISLFGTYLWLGNQTQNATADKTQTKIQIGNPSNNAYLPGYHDSGATNATLNISIGPSGGSASYRYGINIVCSESANYPCRMGLGVPADTSYYGNVLTMAGKLAVDNYGFTDNGAVFIDYEGTTQGTRIYAGPGLDYTLTGYLYSSLNNPYMRVEGSTGATSFLYTNNANGPAMHNINGSTYIIGNLNITGNYTANGKGGLNGNYSIGPCWMAYSGGIAYATNCSSA